MAVWAVVWLLAATIASGQGFGDSFNGGGGSTGGGAGGAGVAGVAGGFSLDSAAAGPQVSLSQARAVSLSPAVGGYVALNVDVPDGYWLYCPTPRGQLVKPTPLSVTLSADPRVKAGESLYPMPHWHSTSFGEADGGAGEQIPAEHNLVYEKSIVVYIPVTVSGDVGEEISLTASLRGQLCDEVGCYPVSAVGEVKLTLAEGAQAIAVADDYKTTAQLDESFGQLPGEKPGTGSGGAGFRATAASELTGWLAVLIALAAGVSLNFMPCVLPVIPIKILSLVKLAGDSNRRRIIGGLSYAVGMLGFFVAVGIISAIVRVSGQGVFNLNEPFKSPGFIISMVMLMTAAACWLFGAFTPNLGSFSGGGGAATGGYLSAAGMGFFTALLATPCSGPVLAVVFGWAQARGAAAAMIIFTALGVGMAAPHALLALWPSLLDKLPAPGMWMERLKQSMGFVLLGVAVWMISVLGDAAWIFHVAILAVILSMALWLGWGVLTLTTPKPKRIFWRVVLIAVVAVSAVVLAPAPADDVLQWRSFDMAGINADVAAGRVVLVKYSAQWCTLCHIVEKKIYHDPRVAELLGDSAIAYSADVTWEASAAEVHLSDTLAEPGPPLTLIYGPALDEPVRLRGVFSYADLAEAIAKARGQ